MMPLVPSIHKRRIVTPVAVVFFCAFAAKAQQPQLMLHAPPSGGLVATDAWNAEVTLQGVPVRVYFEGTIADAQGRVLSEATSMSLMLMPGLARFSTANTQARRVVYRDGEVERTVMRTGNFPEGTYTLCTRLLTSDRDLELVRTCLQVSVKPVVAHADDKRKARSVDLYGTASMMHVMTDPVPADRDLPPTFTRLQADPGISLHGIPVAGQFRYTTEGTDARQDVNMAAVRFDRQRFEHDLRHLVMRKLAESRLASMKENQQLMAQLQEADNLQAVLEDPSLLGLDGELARIRSELGQCYNVTDSAATERCRKLDHEYKALLAKRNQAERLRERMAKLQELRRQLEASGRLDEIRNLQSGELPDLDDPRILASELSRYGAFKGANKYLFSVQELTIGTSFPMYSKLTLNGNQVNGVHTLLNPGPIILGFTHGRTQSYYRADTLRDSRFDQKMTGLRVGFGKLHGSHAVASWVQFSDDKNSIDLPPDGEFHPRGSRVAGLDVQVSPTRKRTFELRGGSAGLMFDHNQLQRTGAFADALSDPLVAAGLTPTLATSYDYAYHGRATARLFKEATTISAGTQYVGPGFIHPGAFGLRNDLVSWDGRIDQAIKGNNMRLSLLYGTERDNLSNGKSTTTTANTAGLEWSLAVPVLPAIRLRLTANDIRSSEVYFRTTIANANLSKAYGLGGIKASTMLNAMYSDMRSDLPSQVYGSIMVSVQQLFAFRHGYSWTLGGQYSAATNEGNTAFGNNGANTQVAKVLWEKLRFAAGANYNTAPGGERVNFNFDIGGNIAKGLTLSAIYNNTAFTAYPGVTGGLRQNYLQVRLLYTRD